MKCIRAMVATSAACLSLLAGRGAEAALVTVNVAYDLSASALHVNYDGVNGLDWYTSLPISLGSVSLSAGDQLRVNVGFQNATTLAGQTILLDQMGLGAATNAPTTFGSPASPAGSHFFGPSLSLFGTGTVATGVVTPSVAAGALSAGYTGATSGTCSAGTCNYGVIFQDLIDGNTTISLSGFSVLFGAAGLASSFSALQFNLIAPAITVSAGVPEPPTPLLVLGALLALAGSAGRRRAAAALSA